MNLVTSGKKYYKDYELFLYLGSDDPFNAREGLNERYKIIFAEEGTGILNINGNGHLFMGPAVFCFNETDDYFLEYETGIKAWTIWFHPNIINKAFDFDTVRKGALYLSGTELQDFYWLEAFTHAPEDFHGQLNVGPGAFKRIKALFDSIGRELEFQYDIHWPCRSRTYLMELLFLLKNLSALPESLVNVDLSITPGDIGEILMYIYSNYMKKITIEDLTGNFHINRTTLNKLFNNATGMPVMNYLIRLRVYLASRMLRETILPVSEIINRVGFNDQAHFGRIFKKHLGYSPSEYRQKFSS